MPRHRTARAAAFAAAALMLAACTLFTDLNDLAGDARDAAVEQPDDRLQPDGGVDGGVDARSEDADSGREDKDADGSADGGCPKGRGPTMVELSTNGTTFCIDSTEVTQAQYFVFLNEKAGDVSGQPAECAWNASYAPRPTCSRFPAFDPVARANHPAGGVDWCDAHAFCKWAGKRLCGGIGGVPLTTATVTDPGKSEWFAACSLRGTQAYPYGFSYDSQACSGGERDGGGLDTVNVGSLTTCEGGVPGLFDMSGNLLEWEDACEPDTDAGSNNTRCPYRGGAYYSLSPELTCASPGTAPRAYSDGDCDLGIRCCADR